MKNVLLATTAIALTAGYASAEMSISASAKLSYGNFGEEHKPGASTKSATTSEGTVVGTATSSSGLVVADATSGAATAIADTAGSQADGRTILAGTDGADVTTGAGYAYGSEFDVVVSGSGEAGGIAYSASMTIDEDAASNSTGTVSMSSGGFTLAYGQNDFGDLVADNDNGLEEAAGDVLLSYAANGLSASYEMSDTGNDAYYMRAGYTGAGLTVGIESADTDGSAAANSAVNTVSVGYTMGAMTVSYDSDDKATTATNPVGNHYDAKITYTMGDTVLSAGTDEVESHYVGLTTSVAGLSLTMRSEQDSKKKADGTLYASSENEVSLSYTMGALTVAYAKDTGDTGKFGDEAETLTTLTYDLGGVKLVAKGNDMDETEVSAAFSF